MFVSVIDQFSSPGVTFSSHFATNTAEFTMLFDRTVTPPIDSISDENLTMFDIRNSLLSSRTGSSPTLPDIFDIKKVASVNANEPEKVFIELAYVEGAFKTRTRGHFDYLGLDPHEAIIRRSTAESKLLDGAYNALNSFATRMKDSSLRTYLLRRSTDLKEAGVSLMKNNGIPASTKADIDVRAKQILSEVVDVFHELATRNKNRQDFSIPLIGINAPSHYAVINLPDPQISEGSFIQIS